MSNVLSRSFVFNCIYQAWIDLSCLPQLHKKFLLWHKFCEESNLNTRVYLTFAMHFASNIGILLAIGLQNNFQPDVLALILILFLFLFWFFCCRHFTWLSIFFKFSHFYLTYMKNLEILDSILQFWSVLILAMCG